MGTGERGGGARFRIRYSKVGISDGEALYGTKRVFMLWNVRVRCARG